MSKRNHPKVYSPAQVNLDIVIPVRNQFDYLKKCLEAIPAACGNLTYHVYIVDNASDPAQAEPFYQSLDAKLVTALGVSENIGFAMACNLGAKTGKGRQILFLNSDCFMSPGSIAQMYSNFLREPKMGIVGAKLVFPRLDAYDPARPVGRIQHAGLTFDISGKPQHIFVGWHADHPKANISCNVPAVTGACLMIERELFQKVGMFHEGYGLGTFEDVDLCFAVRAVKRMVWYDAQALGEHVAGGTAMKEKINFPQERNRYIFVGRWGHMIYWSDPERY